MAQRILAHLLLATRTQERKAQAYIHQLRAQVLALASRQSSSPHAVYQATRLLVSNLIAHTAQRFLTCPAVLLPSILDLRPQSSGLLTAYCACRCLR